MAELMLEKGCEVAYQGKKYRIVSPISLEQVLLEELETGQQSAVKIAEIAPTNDLQLKGKLNTTDLCLISEADWQEAKRRKTVLDPLMDKPNCPLEMAKQAGQQLGLTWRQIYNLLHRYRDYDYQLLALLPHKPTGGKDKTRLQYTAEQIIHTVIKDKYLPNPKIKISLIVEEIKRCCNRADIRPPGNNTIRRRIENIYNKAIDDKLKSRHASKQYTEFFGRFPETERPHAIWQIDHTPVDLIIIDEIYRKPIGRPYLTIAIDTHSRCIPGFCLTLESPSAVSVGLCLTHGVFDKENWLEKRSIKTQWPIWGKPKAIHVDNAAEFHSEALKRGCEAHGIDIMYRPPGKPHYGGTVERVIGTFMQLVHSLPGTTFSNIQEKGDYPSDKKALLTLSELEQWLTIAITDYYHQKVHSGIKEPPIAKYQSAILGTTENPGVGYPPKIHNKTAFLIDFLPIEWRTVQRHGIMIDHIAYSSSTLSPLIAERKKYQSLLIRRVILPRITRHDYATILN